MQTHKAHRDRRNAGVLLALFLVLFVTDANAQRRAVEEARHYVQKAREAYDAGAYDAYLENVEQALALRPNHPGLTYQLAGAYALAGQPDQAVAWLGRYAAMGLFARAANDDAFEALQGREDFADVLAQIAHNAQPVERSTEAFRLSDPAFIPESVVYDASTGHFYVGSVHQRRIVRVDGQGREEAFTSMGQDGLWSVLGMAVDAERRRLWVCSTAFKQTKDLPDGDVGRSGLWRYDLDTGALLQRHLVPDDGREHALGDLTIGPRGELFVTDGLTGALYTLREGGDRLEAVLEPGTLVSPQGLCRIGGDGPLLVADYALGLVKVDTEVHRTTVLTMPEDVTLLGIDGLACYGDELIAIQNGVRPYRVIQISLNAPAEAVVQAQVLEASHPLFDEPTLGVVEGDAFYYVANSQWTKFDQDGKLPDDAALRAPVILQLELGPAEK